MPSEINTSAVLPSRRPSGALARSIPTRSPPDIALSLTTYQKPWHLRRALRSIAWQQGVAGRFELVVTDDGSTDETREIVENFRRQVDFRVEFTTHEHGTFHPARCRNEGVAATTAPYILFLDGDCILPPDHVATHLARRQSGVAMLGDCFRLEREISEQSTEAHVEAAEFLHWGSRDERRRLKREDVKARLYGLLRSSRKPKLVSNNVGLWREDFVRVNGFDENYCGWGCEDDDLGQRLRQCGVRLKSILRWTRSYHLWHPKDVTAPKTWREGPNVDYFLRSGRLTRCRNGLVKRSLHELALSVVGQPQSPEMAAALLGDRLPKCAAPEVELLFLPGEGRFSGRAECQVLIVLAPHAKAAKLARQADVIVADQQLPDARTKRWFKLADLDRALDAIA